MMHKPIYFSYSQNTEGNQLKSLHIFSIVEPFMRIIVIFLLVSYFLLLNAVTSYGETFLNPKLNTEVRTFNKTFSFDINTELFKFRKANSFDSSDFFNTENSEDDSLSIGKYLAIAAIFCISAAIYYLYTEKKKFLSPIYLFVKCYRIYLRNGVLRI